MLKGKRLFLIDGSGYIFRAYYALPSLNRKKDGLPVGAVVGFCNMIWRLISDIKKNSHDSIYLAVIFDHSSKNFRHDIYPEYKSNRPPAPEDLKPQFALIREATRAFGLPCIEKEGFEADDLIATYTRLGLEAGAAVRIISSDKDLMQLIGPNITMYDGLKSKLIGEDEVLEKWGVKPEKMVELQALVGDSVDGVPGVPGIGPKTAALLLNEFETLDNLLEQTSKIKQVKRRESIENHKEQIKISRQLVMLDQNVPIDRDLTSLCLPELDGVSLIGFLKAMEMTTLTRRVAEVTGCFIENIDPVELEVNWEANNEENQISASGKSDKQEVSLANNLTQLSMFDTFDKNILLSCKILTELKNIKFTSEDYLIINEENKLIEFLERAKEQGYLAFKVEKNSNDSQEESILGFSIALSPAVAAYVPLSHVNPLNNELLPDQLSIEKSLAILQKYLEDSSILVIMHNSKDNAHIMKKYGIDICSFDDILLISYILDNGLGVHTIDFLSQRWFDHINISYSNLVKGYKDFGQILIEEMKRYTTEYVDLIFRLWRFLKQRLIEEKKIRVYEKIDRPLVNIILDMERSGVIIDENILSDISHDLAVKAEKLQQEIYDIAGCEFNIASPKQIGEILFDKLQLPLGKKTKTGQWQTSASVLEELSLMGYSIADKMIEWRQCTKLKTTYTDSLPSYVNRATGRIHTTYLMADTSTARLASNNPNLQNIPIRHEEGKKIRNAFIAPEGYKLISADYSQIELRILAELADISGLKKAFINDMDIHAITAAEIFSIPLNEVTSEYRRRAKAINFGIIYGISAFGLAKQLSIPRSQAQDYINLYFQRFPQILSYMNNTKSFVAKNGFVKTLFGRYIYFKELKNSKSALKAGLERAAINAPLQGTAADIIRRAMVAVDKELKKAQLDVKLLLQVHDELIFEVKDSEVAKASEIIKKAMENAAFPYVDFTVNLKVDINHAQNWGDAH